jgi:hypothetical protein
MTPIHRETLEFISSAAGLLFLMVWFVAAVVNTLQKAGDRLGRNEHDEGDPTL